MRTLPAAGLALQLLFFPDSLKQDGVPRKKAPSLPKVSVTDSVFEMRKAFQEAERLGQAQARKDIARQSRDSPDSGEGS